MSFSSELFLIGEELISILSGYISSNTVENCTVQFYRWISIMRHHWKGLLPESPFVQYVLSSESKKINKTFLTLWFGQQEEDFVL